MTLRVAPLFVCMVCFWLAAGLLADPLAGSDWFVDHTGDHDFSNPANWERLPHGSEAGLPEPGEPTYVTAVPGHPDGGHAVLDADATTGGVWVGGWSGGLNQTLGDEPTDWTGKLEIRGGSLAVTPSDRYFRVGFRGGRGEVDQSGGVVSGSRVTLGMNDPASVGVYNLRGDGEVAMTGFDVGVHGMGVLRMTGGTHSGTKTRVGWGMDYASGLPIPGSGAFHQSGGSYETHFLEVGIGAGSVGQLRLDEDASLYTYSSVVGVEGTGSEVLLGGRHEVELLYVLADETGSSGTLLIRGGEFLQVNPRPGSGVVVGRRGAGQIRMEGTGGSARVGSNLFVTGRGLLTFVLFANAPHVSPIQVDGNAYLERGSRIRVLLSEAGILAAFGGYVPEPGQRFVLLTGTRGIVDRGARLIAEDRSAWQLEVGENDLAVVYVGS